MVDAPAGRRIILYQRTFIPPVPNVGMVRVVVDFIERSNPNPNPNPCRTRTRTLTFGI